MFTLHHITYFYPGGEMLFDQLELNLLPHQKASLVGTNGTGKSTLLKIIAGELAQSSGQLSAAEKPYYVPQLFSRYQQSSIAQVLGVNIKLNALDGILAGEASEENFALLADDWTIQERCRQALSAWGLGKVELAQPFSGLSGGEKTKIFLAGISVHSPELVLLDEPSNHLDTAGREQLYAMIEQSRAAMLVVSHDRELLNLLGQTYELSGKGIRAYGGNYDFYAGQKALEQQALMEGIDHQQKQLRKARAIEREVAQRQNKLDARGKGKQERSGVSRIMMNTLRNKAENSTARSLEVHSEKISGIAGELQDLRSQLPAHSGVRFRFSQSNLHKGKLLFSAKGLKAGFGGRELWKDGLDLEVFSGERIAIKGCNGTGKTTLIRIFVGELGATGGEVFRSGASWVYIDQEYALLEGSLSVYQQLRNYAPGPSEHELKARLDWSGFNSESWDRPCSALSGGEKMRLMLCCIGASAIAPELIVLDEPTNNLDLESLAVLTGAIRDYRGTLLVVSHDRLFLKEICCEREIVL